MDIPWFRVFTLSAVLVLVVVALYLRGALFPPTSTSLDLPTFNPSVSQPHVPPAQYTNTQSSAASIVYKPKATNQTPSQSITPKKERPENMEQILDLFLAVPAGWTYKGNYQVGLLTSPDFVSRDVPSDNPQDINWVAKGAKITIEYVAGDAPDANANSSEDFANSVYAAASQAPDSPEVFLKPAKLTVGGIPMVNMGGLAFSDHGGRIFLMGRNNGKNISIILLFAGSYSDVKPLFDTFLNKLQFFDENAR